MEIYAGGDWTMRATANSGTVHRLVLHLVLTGRWFDMMVGGVKNVEYRAMTEHWTRLIWNRRDKITHARFARGYTKETIVRPVRCIDIGPCPYDGWDGDYYRIHMPPIQVENSRRIQRSGALR